MRSNNLLALVHQGFRVTLGAATSLVESIQNPRQLEEPLSKLSELVGNPQKLNENLSILQTELSQRTQEWAEKGEVTEKAAFKIVEDLTKQGTSQTATSTTQVARSPSATATNAYIQMELRELTEQIIALRADLEKLRPPQE